MYTYLILNLCSLSVPLAFSFDPRIRFYKTWPQLTAALSITGAFFIAWDVLFTRWGVWGFNSKYLIGLNILNLPLEEWLFFICIPYACLFTYRSLDYFWGRFRFSKLGNGIAYPLLIVSLLVSIVNYDKLYTAVTFLLLALVLLYLIIKQQQYTGLFFMSYLVILVPFFIINGILTGSFIADEVVWYNDHENLSLRIGTIPVEDIFYGMLLILVNVHIYEKLMGRN